MLVHLELVHARPPCSNNPWSVATDFFPVLWERRTLNQFPLNTSQLPRSSAVVQVYDIGAFSILGLNSSVLVPPLLISFYIVFGTFQILADKALITRPSTQEALSKLSPQYLLVNTWCCIPPVQLEIRKKSESTFCMRHAMQPARPLDCSSRLA